MTQKLKGKRCDTLVKCDRWAELYWKKQIEGDLTPDEERELEALEGEILWNMAVLFSNPLGKVNTVYKPSIKIYHLLLCFFPLSHRYFIGVEANRENMP